MALRLNLGQINAASKNNNDLRETLTGVYNELQAVYQQIGSAPIQKVDTVPASFSGAPPQSQLSVTGANGQFSISLVLPQSSRSGSAPKNPTNTPIYQELSSSPVSNFSTGVVTYPISTSTNYLFPNPGATLYWRLRSSYDQKTWSSYQVQPGGPVAAGKQTSSATENNLALNQSNFATVDSVADGSAATIRIYGSGGVGSAWSRISGGSSQVIPSGTILNASYGATVYVAWDGSQYHMVPSLTQTFSDSWIPVGKVSVIANGSGLVLPTFKAVVSSGAIVAIQITNPGNDLTAAPALIITDSSGSGASAACSVNAGSVTGVTVINAGSGYSSAPTVLAAGGVSNGAAGGGGATGTNGGRIYADV